MHKLSLWSVCCLLILVLGAESQTDGCLIDANCNDSTFCNGVEKCVGGNCQPGTIPCIDGYLCTKDCDENQDQCLTQVCDETFLYNLHPCCCEPVCQNSTICNYCEGDFDNDKDVDAYDLAKFNLDFGRNGLNNPCTNANPCNGDFCCDGDVDAADAQIFVADYGRNRFNNPCPMGSRVPWCNY